MALIVLLLSPPSFDLEPGFDKLLHHLPAGIAWPLRVDKPKSLSPTVTRLMT